jgi:hypothetical protein
MSKRLIVSKLLIVAIGLMIDCLYARYPHGIQNEDLDVSDATRL